MEPQLSESVGGALPGDIVAPTCPFFRSVAIDGAVRPPIEAPDPANRCAASGPLRPQSALQQELVCLTAGHVDCPRYVHGAARIRDSAARRERRGRITRPTTLALAFLLLSAGTSFGFVLTRGGLTLPASAMASPSSAPPNVAAVPDDSPEPVATAEPAAVVATPPTSAAPIDATPPPTPAPTPPPTPVPTPPPTPTPTPDPTPSPEPTDPRYARLEPCPGQAGCWVYTVVSGDSLWAIGDSFGHSLDTVYEWNPWARTERLRVGAEVRLPTPVD